MSWLSQNWCSCALLLTLVVSVVCTEMHEAMTSHAEQQSLEATESCPRDSSKPTSLETLAAEPPAPVDKPSSDEWHDVAFDSVASTNISACSSNAGHVRNTSFSPSDIVAYVVNLPDAKKRRKLMKKQLKSLGIKYRRVKALKSSKSQAHNMRIVAEFHQVDEERAYELYKQWIGDEQALHWANWMSVLKALIMCEEEAIGKPFHFCLVVEDDVEFPQDFITKLGKVWDRLGGAVPDALFLCSASASIALKSAVTFGRSAIDVAMAATQARGDGVFVNGAPYVPCNTPPGGPVAWLVPSNRAGRLLAGLRRCFTVRSWRAPGYGGPDVFAMHLSGCNPVWADRLQLVVKPELCWERGAETPSEKYDLDETNENWQLPEHLLNGDATSVIDWATTLPSDLRARIKEWYPQHLLPPYQIPFWNMMRRGDIRPMEPPITPDSEHWKYFRNLRCSD